MKTIKQNLVQTLVLTVITTLALLIAIEAIKNGSPL